MGVFHLTADGGSLNCWIECFS